MKNFSRITFAVLVGFFSGNLQAQNGGTFTQVEESIEGKVPKSELPTTKGWKAEHRWLDEFKKRVDGNGDFYDGAIFYQEAERLAKEKLLSQNSSKLSGWIPVGPTQRADASLTKGMGRINCIAFHPTDANTYWVGVAQGGVWKTTNSGQTWTPLTDDLPILRISDIAIDPNNPDNMYISVGDYAYVDVALSLDDRKRHSHYGIGVYKSNNGGASWTPTGLTYQLTQLDGSLMRRVYVDPTNSSKLVAAGIGGVWTSADAGTNWTQTSDSMIRDLKMDPNNSNVLYAATAYLGNSMTGSAGIMKSTDFGATWTLLNTGIPPVGSIIRLEMAIAPTNSNHIYAVASDVQSGFYGIYSSIDGGITWTFSTAGGINILDWGDGTSVGGQGRYDLTILVDPVDDNKIYVGGVNLWGSTDGGATFNGMSLWYDGYGDGIHADQHQLKHNPLDGKFYLCNDGGLIRTDQLLIGSWVDAFNIPGYEWPTVWEYNSDGMQTSSFYRVGLSEGNSGNFSAGAQDNSTYSNNGGNWSNLFGGDGMNTQLHPTDPDIIYGSSQYGRILYSDNGGATYGQMASPSFEDGEWVTPFMLEPGNSNKVYAGFGNLYESTPGNNFVNALSSFNDLPGGSVPTPISHFNVAQSNPDYLYVAKRIYHSYGQLSEFWVSENGGGTWENRTNGLPDDMYFSFVEVDANDPLNAWVVVAGFEPGKHVYQTEDAGLTWTNVTYDLPNLPVNCIVHVDNSLYNTIYVGTDIGVYYRNDTTSSWTPYNLNLPNVIIGDLDIHYGDNALYAATFGRGVWKTELIAETIDDSGLEDLLGAVSLNLYPNPNGGAFSLTIDGANSAQLEMEIIDIMGSVVQSTELQLQEGKFHQNFDFKLSSGMYFVKVFKGTQMQTIRFVVE